MKMNNIRADLSEDEIKEYVLSIALSILNKGKYGFEMTAPIKDNKGLEMSFNCKPIDVEGK